MRKILTRSTRHFLLLCFEVIAVLAAVILLAWGGLMLRLDRGPLDLSSLRTPLQQTLNSNIAEYDIRFDNVQLGWGGLRTPFELQMTDVAVFAKDSGMMLAGISQVGLELSKGALLTGEIAPSAINFYNIGLRVFYDQDQGITLTLDHDEEVEGRENILEVLRQGAFAQDAAEKEIPSSLRYLQTVRIIGANLMVQSPNFSEEVILNDTRIVMKKNDAQITTTLDGMMTIRGNQTPLLGHIYFNPEAKSNIASLHFSDLEITDVKSLISEDWRRRLTLEGLFKGTAHINFTNDFQPQNVRFEVNVKNGVFNFDNLFKQAVSFDTLGMISAFDFASGELQFENLQLKNDELEVALSGSSKTIDDVGSHVVLETELKNLPVNDIGEYWPQNVLPDARTWVSENIRNGLVTSAAQKLDIVRGKNKTDINILEGEIQFEKAEVKYLPDFPVVENVAGTARFDPQSFVIDIDGGLYKQTQLTPSKITIYGFDQKPKIDIALNIQTTVSNALEILDSKPYRFTSKMDLPYQNMSGNAAVNLNFSFPLKNDLQQGDVSYTAGANIFNFAWPGVYRNLDLNDANVALDLDAKKLKISGKGFLPDGPASFEFEKYFNAPSLQSFLTLNTAAEISRFLPAESLSVINFSGAAPLFIEQREFANSKKIITIQADLQTVEFEIPALDIDKEKGVSGQADFTLKLENNQLRKVENLNFVTPVLSFSGDADIVSAGAGYDWQSAVLSNMRFGENDFNLNARKQGQDVILQVNGSQFDVSRYLKNENEKADAQQGSKTPLKISGQIDRLITSSGGLVANAKIFLESNSAGRIDKLELDGAAGRGQLYLRYKPAEGGGQGLRLEADDAGAALRILGYSKSVKGGVMVVDGRPLENAGPRDMAGRFQISNFTVSDAPVLARLLNGMSVTGLSALLQGAGIDLARLSGDFKWQDKDMRRKDGGLITIMNGKTSGASLGLTFDGTLDMASKTMDIDGNLVPVSNLNTAFSNIPVLGDLLTGGGDGVFAATYSLSGDIKNPTTTVNPLAALAPGVLRDIFFENATP